MNEIEFLRLILFKLKCFARSEIHLKDYTALVNEISERVKSLEEERVTYEQINEEIAKADDLDGD